MIGRADALRKSRPMMRRLSGKEDELTRQLTRLRLDQPAAAGSFPQQLIVQFPPDQAGKTGFEVFPLQTMTWEALEKPEEHVVR